MKHLVTLIVAGVMALLLTACGQESPKQPEVKTQNVATPAAAAPAPAPAAAATTEQAPATEEAPK